MTKKKIEMNIMKTTIKGLRKRILQLPVIKGGTEPKEHEMIGGVKDNARFRISKEESEKHSGCILCVVCVSGSSKENRLALISVFKTLLGNPSAEFSAKTLSDADSLYWGIKKIQ